MIARSVLFRPGGPLACELARHAVVLKVNDWIFCHGGLLPHHGKIINFIYMNLPNVRVFFFFFSISFEMSDRSLDTSTVAYGIEKMNMEVSYWMRGLIEEDSSPHMPFMATKGYDSVVWSRLYSRDISDLENYQINKASTTN